MRALAFSGLVLTLFGCGNRVTVIGGSGGGSSGSIGATTTSAVGSTGAGATSGTPCPFLHGTVTLTSWDGGAASYAEACYSFRLASNDLAVTKNEVDVLYQGNAFVVNTVTDDQSFIVDLGDVPLDKVPSTVDPSQYPTGAYGAHDVLDAVLDHTYLVRTADHEAQLFAAFRVVGVDPGSNVTIEWEKSVDPTKMVIPVACLK